MALADSGHLDRRLHRVVSECRHLSRALGDVGEQAEAIVLPQVSRADPDVVEHSGAELAVVARTMREVRVRDFGALSDGRVAHGAGVFGSVEIFSAAGGGISLGTGGFVGRDQLHRCRSFDDPRVAHLGGICGWCFGCHRVAGFSANGWWLRFMARGPDSIGDRLGRGIFRALAGGRAGEIGLWQKGDEVSNTDRMGAQGACGRE